MVSKEARNVCTNTAVIVVDITGSLLCAFLFNFSPTQQDKLWTVEDYEIIYWAVIFRLQYCKSFYFLFFTDDKKKKNKK